jgi:N-acetyl-anhydromuramyl-L-alanine amidase AmpD
VAGSINNFALHLSLETPEDGEDEAAGHSGYTQAQYDTMAIELAQWMQRFSIPVEHITTHRYVDLGGERADPRSLDWNELGVRFRALGLLCGRA